MNTNNKTLIIVESASKCKKIEEYLGYSYKCMACFGHIREIKDIKSIDFNNNYAPFFNEIKSKKNQINKLKNAINSYKEVILATDNDREGEAIAWHICELFNLNINTTKRIIFNEITYNAIQNAVKNPIKIDMNLVHAQIARQILDLIIGFKVTPILWKYVKHPYYTVLSAGRCQTPALRIIYDNQIEIDNYDREKTYIYKTFGYFTNQNICFSLQYDFDTSENIINFLELTKNFNHTYERKEINTEYRNAPEPLITSTLQQELCSIFNISPKETMNISQSLYEQGYITYMRTDSKHYSSEFINKTKTYIYQKYGEKYFTNNVNKLISNKNTSNSINNNLSSNNSNSNSNSKTDFKTQEAHEAIRPTNIELCDLPSNFNGGQREKNVYKYIWERTIKSLMSNCILSTFISTITTPLNNIYYKHKSEKIIFDGWKIISSFKSKNKFNDNNYNSYNSDINNLNIENNDITSIDTTNDREKYYEYLLNLKKGSIVNYKKICCNYSIKSSKYHHNEAELVKLLERKGIGRPSTFSTLVDKIQKREYVKKQNIESKIIKSIDYELKEKTIYNLEVERNIGGEKHKLVIQPIGNTILSFLINNFNDIFEYDYTKRIEDDLDEIAKGNKLWYTLCKECDDNLNIEINRVESFYIKEKEVEKEKKREMKEAEKEKKREMKEAEKEKKRETKKMEKEKKREKHIEINKNIINIEEINMNNDNDNINNDNITNITNTDNTNVNIHSTPTINNDIFFENKLKKGLKMGKYDNEDLYLKKGRYGLYVQWGENKKSLNGINIEPSLITHNNIISYINNVNNFSIQKCIDELNKPDGSVSTEDEQNKTLIRILNPSASIRRGKYGDYIFYKPKNSTKPEFISLKKYKGNYKTDPIPTILDWITTTKYK